MALSLIGNLFRDINWRYMQIALVVFSAYSLVEWWYVRNDYIIILRIFNSWREENIILCCGDRAEGHLR